MATFKLTNLQVKPVKAMFSTMVVLGLAFFSWTASAAPTCQQSKVEAKQACRSGDIRQAFTKAYGESPVDYNTIYNTVKQCTTKVAVCYEGCGLDETGLRPPLDKKPLEITKYLQKIFVKSPGSYDKESKGHSQNCRNSLGNWNKEYLKQCKDKNHKYYLQRTRATLSDSDPLFLKLKEMEDLCDVTMEDPCQFSPTNSDKVYCDVGKKCPSDPSLSINDPKCNGPDDPGGEDPADPIPGSCGHSLSTDKDGCSCTASPHQPKCKKENGGIGHGGSGANGETGSAMGGGSIYTISSDAAASIAADGFDGGGAFTPPNFKVESVNPEFSKEGINLRPASFQTLGNTEDEDSQTDNNQNNRGNALGNQNANAGNPAVGQAPQGVNNNTRNRNQGNKKAGNYSYYSKERNGLATNTFYPGAGNAQAQTVAANPRRRTRGGQVQRANRNQTQDLKPPQQVIDEANNYYNSPYPGHFGHDGGIFQKCSEAYRRERKNGMLRFKGD